ncbi:FAD-dependent monooxygenase [Rhodovulum sp. DZ06]|uniref:FAD-dependent monooxygenase n=1 Tax=Rhodovulum sp. DZ06 TaxID=3425126 RepID=UPI003D34E929
MTELIETDILVVGGGAAGLSAAAIFAAEGFETLCVDLAAPVVDQDAPGADLRTAALMTPSADALDAAGAWARLAPEAAPLWTMRLLDSGGQEEEVRRRADFEAGEMQDRPFGWNLPNTVIRKALIDHLAEDPRATLRAPDGLAALTLRTGEALARLESGARVRAKLVVAADGRDSPTREMAGLKAHRWGYAQKALVFAVSHPRPHQGVSTELHRTGGPFTLVPLPDRGGLHRSSVVWMEDGPKAHALLEMDEAAFSAAATARSCGVLGELTLASRRAMWPIVSQLAERLDGPRVALVGETAHVVPPIGAQGLNMSIADAAALAQILAVARGKGQDIGAPGVLSRYSRARWPGMAARVGGIDALNRAAQADAQPLRDLRALGLAAIHGTAPVRRAVMKMGMGANG